MERKAFIMIKKQSIVIKVFKFFAYAIVGIIILIGLLLYSQTTETKSFTGQDYAIMFGGFIIILLASSIEDLKNRIDDLESRLDEIENGSSHDFDVY